MTIKTGETCFLPAARSPSYTRPFDHKLIKASHERESTVPFIEITINAPALSADELGAGEQIRYDIQTDDDPAFPKPTMLAKGLIVQKGEPEGGCGATAAQYRLTSSCRLFLRVAAINSGGGDCSDKIMGAEVRF